MKNKINGKIIFNSVVFAMSGALLVYFCLSKNGLSDLIKNAHNFNLLWLGIAILTHLTNIFIDAFLILKFTKGSGNKYTFKRAIKTCMVGQFFSAITPGASGGQPMQIYMMSKQKIDPGTATSCLMQKFLVYQISLSIYSAVAIIIRFNFFNNMLNKVMWLAALVGFLSQVFIIFLILMFSFHRRLTRRIILILFKVLYKLHLNKDPDRSIEKLEEQLQSFHSGNKELIKNKKFLLETFALTMIQLTVIFLVPYCIYRSFNLSGARIIDMVCSQSFVSMTSSLVPLPGAAGASEGSFLVFFANFFTEETLKPSVLLWRFITYYLTIFISAPFSRIKKEDNNDSPLNNQVEVDCFEYK